MSAMEEEGRLGGKEKFLVGVNSAEGEEELGSTSSSPEKERRHCFEVVVQVGQPLHSHFFHRRFKCSQEEIPQTKKNSRYSPSFPHCPSCLDHAPSTG